MVTAKQADSNARKVEAIGERLGLRPLQRMAAIIEIVRLAKAGKTKEQIAAALQKKTVAGFDWSKIDLAKILELVMFVLKIFL